MNRLIVAITLLTGIISAAYGQDVAVTANAPSTVKSGQAFRIEYTLNVQGAQLGQPDLTGLDYYGASTSQSVSIVNGSMTVKYSVYYTVAAPKAGTYKIPPVTAEYNGKTYKSKELVITAQDNPQQNQAQNQGGSQNQQQSQAEEQVSGSGNLFIDVNVNKKEVYVGQHIVLSAGFYSRYNIQEIADTKLPSYNGFWVKEISTPSRITLQQKLINGVPYSYGLLHKKVLIPQRAGELVIEPYSIDFITREGFWDSYKRTGKSTAKTIKVKQLPSPKPDNFGGAVGSFNISMTADKEEVKLDDPLTIKVTLTGNGNIQLCEAPKVDIPSAFEAFPPKSAENIKTDDNGMSGTRTFSYVAIARQPCEITIPAVKFSYFDLASKSYKTVSTNELTIKITGERDSTATAFTGGVIKSDVENLGSDIRFIKQGFELKSKKFGFFNSFEFWMIILVLALAFTAVILLRLQQIKNNANLAAVKNRKAGRTSRKRLKKAAEYMKQNKKDEFYEEVLNALWGYLGDKLEMPASELTRDNVVEKLGDKGVSKDAVEPFVNTLNDCEFERYAPSGLARPLQDMYTRAAEAIEQMENNIKN
ncbi:MAG: BatD family protein [Bacteroidales bacterium]|nr:BatD family protein [Bacteroidales bacterium]